MPSGPNLASSLLSTLSRSLQGHDEDARARAVPSLILTTEPPDEPRNPHEWAQLYRRLEGRRFSLDRHRPLRAIYSDPHEHIVIGKPAQRGVSELAINYAGFALDKGAEAWTNGEKDGLNVAYIFPKKESLGDFSKERLSGLTRETPYLQKLFGDDEFNAVTFKQVRQSYLYLRGGWSTSALKSFPADVLILDEYDEMAPSAIALARRRLNASMVHREVDISTPSVPGRGIHALFLESDQHVYEQLHRCGEWVRYDFLRDVRCDGEPHDVWGEWPAEKVRRTRVTLVCPNCAGPVSEEERLVEGRWHADAPEVRGLRGYWVPPMAFPVANLTRLAANAVNPEPFEREQFFQSDLGLPYAVGGSKITLEMILQLATPLEHGHLPQWPSSAWRDTTMGVDVGARWHWKVSSTGPDGQRYIRGAGAVFGWDQIDALMRHFRVRRCIVDAQPELDGAKQFAARWPGRVLRAFYPGPSALKGQLYHIDGLDLKKLANRKRLPKTDVIQINRTMAMDRVVSLIVRCREAAPLEVVNDPELQLHLQAPTRTIIADSHGQPVAFWVHTQPDHTFHAFVYDLVARETLPPPSAAAGAAGVAGGARQAGAPPTGAGRAEAQARRSTAPAVARGLQRRQQLRRILAGGGATINPRFTLPSPGRPRRGVV
jgi:hypothetical protein